MRKSYEFLIPALSTAGKEKKSFVHFPYSSSELGKKLNFLAVLSIFQVTTEVPKKRSRVWSTPHFGNTLITISDFNLIVLHCRGRNFSSCHFSLQEKKLS